MSSIPPGQQPTELVRRLVEHAREGTEVEDLPHALIRLGARKLIQELLEARVRSFWSEAPRGTNPLRKALATATRWRTLRRHGHAGAPDPDHFP